MVIILGYPSCDSRELRTLVKRIKSEITNITDLKLEPDQLPVYIPSMRIDPESKVITAIIAIPAVTRLPEHRQQNVKEFVNGAIRGRIQEFEHREGWTIKTTIKHWDEADIYTTYVA